MSSNQQETTSQRTVNSKKPHRNLIAWQKAMDLALKFYKEPSRKGRKGR